MTEHEHAASSNTAMVMEYVSKTPITYGSNIALQAHHGGYMSLWDPVHLKASAHKILPHTKFKILKSSELSFLGNVLYGDPVWLQSTSGHDVLGAFYEMKSKEGASGGHIKPALISCRKNHMFKAQQYGRWIVLNKDDPIGTLSQQVGHRDKVILEQEWYYLSSLTPYTSGMFKIKDDIDDALKSGLDLFYPPNECGWKFHLVDLPNSNNEEDVQTSQILFNAMNQISNSKKRRVIKANELLMPLSKKIPESKSGDSVVRDKLLHKFIPDDNARVLALKFNELSKKKFAHAKGSKEFIKRIYGTTSAVYLCAVFVESMQVYREYGGNKQPTFVEIFEEEMGISNHAHKSNLEKADDLYWREAQKVLTDVKAWNELIRAMSIYFGLDSSKKLRSIKVIQRFLRRCLDLKFSWARSMRIKDEFFAEKETKRRYNVLLLGGNFDDVNPDTDENDVTTGSFLLNSSHDIDALDPAINRSRSRSMSNDFVAYFKDFQDDINDEDLQTTERIQTSQENSSRNNIKLTFPVQGYMSPVPIPLGSPMSTRRNIRPNTSGLLSPTYDNSPFFTTTQASPITNRVGSPSAKRRGESSHATTRKSPSASIMSRSFSAPSSSDLVIGYPSIISDNASYNIHQNRNPTNEKIHRQLSFDSNASMKSSISAYKKRMLKLPSDVIDNEITKTNLSADTGMKFLRAISSKSVSKMGMFDEIIVKKKPFTHSSIL